MSLLTESRCRNRLRRILSTRTGGRYALPSYHGAETRKGRSGARIARPNNSRLQRSRSRHRSWSREHGVSPAIGGVHPGPARPNALLSLGSAPPILEIIARTPSNTKLSTSRKSAHDRSRLIAGPSILPTSLPCKATWRNKIRPSKAPPDVSRRTPEEHSIITLEHTAQSAERPPRPATLSSNERGLRPILRGRSKALQHDVFRNPP